MSDPAAEPWLALYKQHREARTLAEFPDAGLRRRLVRLVRDGKLDASAPHRFTRRDTSKKHLRALELRGMTEDSGAELKGLVGILQARLNLQLLVERRGSTHHLRELKITVEGRNDPEIPFFLAVHLPDDGGPNGDHCGTGACGHAALHAHVGLAHGVPLTVRSPLPALSPSAALDWAITQLYPEWEPCRWQKAPSAPPS